MLQRKRNRASEPLERPFHKRAVVIGLQYASDLEIKMGGVYDTIENAKELYKLRFHFNDLLCLKDPTKDEILESMDWLIKDTLAGDVLIFHFCGLGNKNGDFLTSDSHTISKEELQNRLFQCILPKVSLLCVFDYTNASSQNFRFIAQDRQNSHYQPSEIQKGNYIQPLNFHTSSAFLQMKENEEVSELWGSVMCVWLKDAKDGMTLSNSIINVLNYNYAHTLSIKDFLCRLCALIKINNLHGKPMIEFGKYIDEDAPVGRFISAPI